MPPYARRLKESHLDTVHYEVEMVRFCADRLLAVSPTSLDRVGFVLLEGFLLHFRNVLEVLSRTGRGRFPDDLYPSHWAGRDLTEAEVRNIIEPAKALRDRWFDDLSKYIQHCTTRRHAFDQGWDVAAMLHDIEPVLSAFETSFPNEH